MTDKAAPDAGGAFAKASKEAKDAFFVHVGKRIRRRRRLLGMTQQNLADEVGLKFQQIQKYEIGANKPDFEVISKMAKAMNVHLTYFLEPVYETPARGHGNPEIPPDLAELVELYPTLTGLKQKSAKKIIDGIVESNKPASDNNPAAP